MKENLKPCVYKLWKDDSFGIVQPRTFCRTVRRVAGSGEVKWEIHGAEGIPSLKRAYACVAKQRGAQSLSTDPKPGDLSMSRMKMP